MNFRNSIQPQRRFLKFLFEGIRGMFFFFKKVILAMTLPRDKMVTYAGLSERRRECSRALFKEVSLSNTPFTGPTTDSKPCMRKVKALCGWL